MVFLQIAARDIRHTTVSAYYVATLRPREGKKIKKKERKKEKKKSHVLVTLVRHNTRNSWSFQRSKFLL